MDVGVEEDFENELSNVLNAVLIITEFVHVEDGELRVVLDDLSQQTDYRQSSCLSKIRHVVQL